MATPSGPVGVEDLRIGQDVICVSEAGDEVVGQVATKKDASTGSYLELWPEGCERPLRVTNTHPVAGAVGWIPAGKLAVGDWVQTRSGLRRLTALTIRRENTRVYDLSVRPHPTFLAADVLVHNKSVAIPPKTEDIAGDWVGFLDYYVFRLVLYSDGTGSFAWARPKYSPQIYSVDRWTLRSKVSTGVLEFQIHPIECHWEMPAMRLRGRVSSAIHLDLEVGFQKHETAWNWLAVNLIRESDHEAQSRTLGELKQRMASSEAPPAAATSPTSGGPSPSDLGH